MAFEVNSVMGGEDHARLAAAGDQLCGLRSNTMPGDRALAHHLVDDVEHAKAPASGKLLVDEI